MTSDSYFTSLVMWILANGLKVFGFGDKKTPLPFIKACSQFIFTEKLVDNEETYETGDFEQNNSENHKITIDGSIAI